MNERFTCDIDCICTAHFLWQRPAHITYYYKHLSLQFNKHTRVLSASTYTHTRTPSAGPRWTVWSGVECAWCSMNCRLTIWKMQCRHNFDALQTQMDAYCGTSIQYCIATLANESPVCMCVCAMSTVCTQCNCYHEYYVTIILMANTALKHCMHRPLRWFGWSSKVRIGWPICLRWNVPASFE